MTLKTKERLFVGVMLLLACVMALAAATESGFGAVIPLILAGMFFYAAVCAIRNREK